MKSSTQFLILTFLLLSKCPVFSQNWAYQNPSITAEGFLKVQFVSLMEGWAVSSNGLFHTNDGGKNWAKQSSATELMSSIFFVDKKNGWVLGSYGVVLHTTDGGLNWENQFVGKGYRGNLFFVDKNNGWAIGQKGFFARTTDSGKNWEILTVPTTENLLSIHFIDTKNGWVAGENGLIMATKDGGTVWEKQVSTSGLSLISLRFFDKNNGLICNNNGQVIRTHDGGKLWETPTLSIGSGYVQKAFFADTAHIWIVGGIFWASNFVYKSSNGGQSWDNQMETKADFGNDFGGPYPLTDIFFWDNNSGWAAGLNGAIYSTIDGGNAWEAQFERSPVENLYSIYFLNEKLGWAVGQEKDVFKTTDGGKHWSRKLVANTGGTWSSVFFTDENNGWAVGSFHSGNAGGCIRSKDGGENWQKVTLNCPPDTRFSKVLFTDAKHGWIVGDYIFRTVDGGENWAFLGTAGGWNYIMDISFVNNEEGWGLFNGGRAIKKTTDGGQTWTTQLYAFNKTIYDFQFIDRQNGWFVSDDGIIFHTSDGGKNWVEQFSGTSNQILTVHFVDNQFGWAGGSDILLFTSNGGTDWELIDPPILSKSVFDIFFTDRQHGWLCGAEGVILAYQDDLIPKNIVSLPTRESIWPNPFHDAFNIEMESKLDDQPAQFFLYNQLGQLIFEKNETLHNGGNTLAFSTDRLANGMYYFRVMTKEASKTYKLLKK